MATVTNRRSVMTLFADPKDLQGHSVRLVLMEKDINVEINYVTDENKPEDLNTLNPYGKLLTLIDRDLVLYDSQIMMEYLDERYPHPPLMPVDPVARAANRQLRYRISQDLYSLAFDIENGDQLLSEKSKKLLRDNLLILAPIFEQFKYFMSDEFSLVDLCMSTILWRLEHWNIRLGLSEKQLTKYAEQIFEMESFQSSLSDYEREMRV
jgi:RNA polymerase-associated protein